MTIPRRFERVLFETDEEAYQAIIKHKERVIVIKDERNSDDGKDVYLVGKAYPSDGNGDTYTFFELGAEQPLRLHFHDLIDLLVEA